MKETVKYLFVQAVSYLYLHGLGLHHINLVPVAAPNLVMHHSHATDGVVGFPQV